MPASSDAGLVGSSFYKSRIDANRDAQGNDRINEDNEIKQSNPGRTPLLEARN